MQTALKERPLDRSDGERPKTTATKTNTSIPLPQLLSAPRILRDLPNWLVWKFEANGDKKPRKVPYYVHGGRRSADHGSEKDRAQLVAFADAVEACRARGMDGVGLAMLEGSGVVALDFDNVLQSNGEPIPETGNRSLRALAWELRQKQRKKNKRPGSSRPFE